MIFAILVLVFLALVLLLKQTATQSSRILYSDTGSELIPAKPLRSDRHRLIGKPDYLVQRKKLLIPIEVKKHNCPPSGVPYLSEKLQLAANCLLVEEAYNKPVRYGELHYGDGRMVRVQFNQALRRELFSVLEEMRFMAGTEQRRSHSERSRCLNCSFRGRCGQELA